MKNLDSWDKFKFSLYTGIGGAATQLGGVMAQGTSIDWDIVMLTTGLTFLVHYCATSNKFIQEKIDLIKKSREDGGLT